MLYQYFRDTQDADSKKESPVVFDVPSLVKHYVDQILDFLNECRFQALDYEDDVEDLLRPEFLYYGPSYMEDDTKSSTTVITATMKESSDIKSIRIFCCGATALELRNIVFYIYYCGKSAVEKIVVVNETTKSTAVITEKSRIDH